MKILSLLLYCYFIKAEKGRSTIKTLLTVTIIGTGLLGFFIMQRFDHFIEEGILYSPQGRVNQGILLYGAPGIAAKIHKSGIKCKVLLLPEFPEDGLYSALFALSWDDCSNGNYVVSMRPVKRELVPLAVSITEKMDYAHGAPVQLGNPEEIGIFDIEHPDYGDPLEIADDEIPVFWACGVTAQAAAQQTKPEIMISHSPGYMLITDIRISDLSK